MCRLEENVRQTVALWQWSHVLEHKVFQSWRAHTVARRRKTDRYARAMARHRLALLGMGVRQWIHVRGMSVLVPHWRE